jgi:hypothetical protein
MSNRTPESDALERHVRAFLSAIESDPGVPEFLKEGAPGLAELSVQAAGCRALCKIEYWLCRAGGDAAHCRAQYERCKENC